MRKLYPILLLFLAVSSASLFGASAPSEKLSTTIDKALDVLFTDNSSGLSLAEKEAKISQLLDSNYDLNVLIRRSLGRNWNLLKPSEQAKVTELIKQLTVRAFVKNLDGQVRPKVMFGEDVMVTDKRVEIPSTIVTADMTFNVMYRMGFMRSGWQIYDIVAENISVVSNFRQQFDDHFRKQNGAELITKLEKLLQEGNLDANTKI